jgi:glyoxylase-like metal-dependent hydrolase (beta-lactamase superfamily II)
MIRRLTPAVTRLDPALLRVTAPNASPMTAEGTNAYVLSGPSSCVIDPGPDDAHQLGALLAVLAGRPVSHIVVTHGHADHLGLARTLGAATGGRVVTHRELGDGEEVVGEGWRLRVLHTPGHTADHICLDDGANLFTGDQAMGWATTVVDPPDGDMGQHMASLHRLLELGPRRLLPGHGPVVEDGPARLRALIAHREAREEQILDALATERTPEQITAELYAGLPRALRWSAERNVLAHLLDLYARGFVEKVDENSFIATGRRLERLL